MFTEQQLKDSARFLLTESASESYSRWQKCGILAMYLELAEPPSVRAVLDGLCRVASKADKDDLLLLCLAVLLGFRPSTPVSHDTVLWGLAKQKNWGEEFGEGGEKARLRALSLLLGAPTAGHGELLKLVLQDKGPEMPAALCIVVGATATGSSPAQAEESIVLKLEQGQRHPFVEKGVPEILGAVFRCSHSKHDAVLQQLCKRSTIWSKRAFEAARKMIVERLLARNSCSALLELKREIQLECLGAVVGIVQNATETIILERLCTDPIFESADVVLGVLEVLMELPRISSRSESENICTIARSLGSSKWKFASDEARLQGYACLVRARPPNRPIVLEKLAKSIREGHIPSDVGGDLIRSTLLKEALVGTFNKQNLLKQIEENRELPAALRKLLSDVLLLPPPAKKNEVKSEPGTAGGQKSGSVVEKLSGSLVGTTAKAKPLQPPPKGVAPVTKAKGKAPPGVRAKARGKAPPRQKGAKTEEVNSSYSSYEEEELPAPASKGLGKAGQKTAPKAAPAAAIVDVESRSSYSEDEGDDGDGYCGSEVEATLDRKAGPGREGAENSSKGNKPVSMVEKLRALRAAKEALGSSKDSARLQNALQFPAMIWKGSEQDILVVSKPPHWMCTASDLDVAKRRPPLEGELVEEMGFQNLASLLGHKFSASDQKYVHWWMQLFHAGDRDRYPTLFDRKQNYGLVKGLDREASGALMYGTTQRSREQMKNAIDRQLVRKAILTLVHGIMYDDTVTVDQKLETVGQRARLCETGRAANTRIRVLAHYQRQEHKNEKFTLCACEVLHEQHHQVRLHLAGHLGNPVVSEYYYQAAEQTLTDREWCDRLFLHVYAVDYPESVHGPGGSLKDDDLLWHLCICGLPRDLRAALGQLEPINGKPSFEHELLKSGLLHPSHKNLNYLESEDKHEKVDPLFFPFELVSGGGQRDAQRSTNRPAVRASQENESAYRLRPQTTDATAPKSKARPTRVRAPAQETGVKRRRSNSRSVSGGQWQAARRGSRSRDGGYAPRPTRRRRI